ncbi:MAG: hypothetical protein ISR22_02335 [Candidatus Poseidoniaceae archaeon]|nr:hypothetical protein [Candidatus Poseidoniaceae archaeon]
MNNKAYPSYRQIIGISLILFSIVSFLFPHLFQSSLESKELVEKVDYRIRLSAVPLGIGLFFTLLSKFQSKHILTQSLFLAFFIDMGFSRLGYSQCQFTVLILPPNFIGYLLNWL